MNKHLHLMKADRTTWARFDNRVGSYYTGSLKDDSQNYDINSHKVKEYRKRKRKTKSWQRLLKAWYDPKTVYIQDVLHHRYCTEYIVLGWDGMTDMPKTMEKIRRDFNYLNDLLARLGEPPLQWTDKLDASKVRTRTNTTLTDEQILKHTLLNL